MPQTTRYEDASSNPARLALIPVEDRGWFELLSRPDYPAIEQQIRDVGACENPVWLSGRTLLVAIATGEVISSWSSAAPIARPETRGTRPPQSSSCARGWTSARRDAG